MKHHQGNRLKIIIEKSGIDKKKLIENSKIPHTTFYRLLNKKEIVPKNFFNLLENLKVPVNVFFDEGIKAKDVFLSNDVRNLFNEISQPSIALSADEDEKIFNDKVDKRVEIAIKNALDNSMPKNVYRKLEKEYMNTKKEYDLLKNETKKNQ